MHRRLLASAAVAAALLLVGGPAAYAEDGTLAIGHVEPGADGTIQVLVSVPEGAEVQPDDVKVSIGDTVLDSTAESAGTATDQVRRTTVIAFDTSNSMALQGRLEGAKQAASSFLAAVPDDVYVGIVTFDADVETALPPSQDRAAAQSVIDDIQLAQQTRLNDGVIQAVDVAGTEGQRDVLVLSDGRDTSKTPESAVTKAITDADVRVDVVALDQSGAALAPLKAMSDAGGGSVISADADALEAAFASEAAALARQILVTATVPESIPGQEATVQVSASIDGTQSSSSTYAVIRGKKTESGPDLVSDAGKPALTITEPMMLAGLGGVAIGLLILLVGLMVAPRQRAASAEQRILAYGGASTTTTATTSSHRSEAAPALDQAKDAAAKVLNRNRGLEERISMRLEGAGSALKPAEWLLLHSAIAIAGGLVGLLIGGGGFFFIALGLFVGWLLPKLWLGFKRKRRLKAFNAQLADTLQLISGSLSAGMSLGQAIDTVVREGQEPIAGEFKRVLVETRLGVTIDDALEGIAERLESPDFAWVVMAIRIQRQVGGNLAELLTTVAATLRERDYLRRQIKSLSAEGVLSAYILGAMPIAITLFLMATRPDYIMPLFQSVTGLMLVAAAAGLLGMAAFVMSRLVKVEV